MMRHSVPIAVVAMCGSIACENERPEPGSQHDVAARKEADVVVETPKGGGAAAPKGRVKREQVDLEGTAALIRDGRVEDGKQLEVEINANQRNRVDVDGDGRRDRLQVVEHRDGDTRRFDVRAIPSSKRKAKPDEVAVVVETIDVARRGDTAHVTARYSDVVIVDDPVVIAFDVPVVVDTFGYWVLVVDRPVFVGVPYVVIDTYDVHMKGKHKKFKKQKKKFK